MKLIKQEYGFLGDMIHVNACSVGIPPMRTQRAACSFMDQYLPMVYGDDTPMDFFAHAERFEGGSTNTMGIWMLHHSLSFVENLGKENIHAHVLELEAGLRQKLAGCGLDVLPPGDLPSGVVVAWYPAAHYDQAEAILKKYGIHISHHAGYLRLSIAAHNTEEQMEIVAEAFREIGGLKGR